MNLTLLGAELLARRKVQGVSRAELARRVGVTATYVWMVEGARPRPNGRPSVPRREVLERWAAVLGLEGPALVETLQLAGHGSSPGFYPRVVESVPDSVRPLGPTLGEAVRGSPAGGRSERLYPMAGPGFVSGRDLQRDGLLGRLRTVLLAAEGADRWEETISLLDSYLDWLLHHLEREE